MPLKNWRPLLFAALAVLGPAVSWADAPVDFRKAKIDGEARRELSVLGYRFDEKSGHVFTPDGTALGQDGLKELVAPVDYRKEAIAEEERNTLVLGGCRFDEGSGHILCIDDKTKDKSPVLAIGLRYMRKMNSLITGHAILERMSLLLSKEDADKPVPPEAAAQLKSMLEKSPGAAVPEDLVKALAAPGLKAGQARARLEDAYASSTRFFDGQESIGDRLRFALPVVPGWNEPRRTPQFFDDTEKKLGEALRDSAVKHYARSPIGRELLDHYKGKDGKVHLPPFLILKLDPRQGAIYNQQNKTVVFNQQYVIEGITAGLPEARRDALREQLQDSRRFAAYLLAHPEAREALLKRNDVDLYHELTHGWQDRRDRILDEMGRGNTPSAIHIEYEQEAFLAQNRYMHWKVAHAPAAAKDDPRLADYLMFITNFAKYRDGVAQEYLQAFPKDAATLRTVEDLQKERVGIARRLMGESWHSAAVQLLKLLGMAGGSTEISRVATEDQKRTAAFLKDQYPQMQREGRRALVEVYLLKAKSDKTPIERDDDLNSAESWAKASGDPALVEKVKKARPKR